MPHLLPIESHSVAFRSTRILYPVVLGLWVALALLAFCGFVALGTWQVHRLHWKHDLIERVTQRVHAPPLAAPGQDRWQAVDAERNEYQRVRLTGTFLNQDETFVQATTELGAGFWVLTPLRLADGSLVLVNRGFVSPPHRDPAQRGLAPPQGEMTVTGLLRMSEPGGAFLRRNDPSQGRWYSRDVQAIGAALGLTPVAPFFVDEEAGAGMPRVGPASSAPKVWPVPGLTVIDFRDNHLSYAITWYVLALMVAVASVYVGRLEYRQWRRRGQATGSEQVQRT